MTAPAVYRLLLVHVAGPSGPGAPAVSEPREFASRYVQLPASCPDCTGRPRTSAVVPEGFSAAVVIEHDPTCPAVRAVLRRAGRRP